MRIPFYQVDAFSDGPFTGNPAAVCLLTCWPEDEILQRIAQENNLSETAFYVRDIGDKALDLRWFTPKTEVELCGHATLATAVVLSERHPHNHSPLVFSTRSGILTVQKNESLYSMNFPAQQATVIDMPTSLPAALGLESEDIEIVLQASDTVVVLREEALLDTLLPDFPSLQKIPTRGVVVTTASSVCDFRSRWFGPQVGVNEDPLTGSAHTFLAPFWAVRLGKTTLQAVQGGSRKGRITCAVLGTGRVELAGKGEIVIQGEFILE
jgi:PhzF family phenazine biosynthesis protein